MKTKLIYFFFFLGLTLSAQEITIDDEKVMLNGKQILKSEKINVSEYTFYSVATDDEVISFRFHNNESPKYLDDDYFILTFVNQKVRIESMNKQRVFAGLGMNSRKNMEKLLNWLLKEKVIDAEGNINIEKLQNFATKYNENITNRTVRY